MLIRQDRFLLSRIPIILVILATTMALPVFGDDNTEKMAWEQFALGLELHIAEKTDKALLIMEEIILDYPKTEAAGKAAEYIENSKNILDRSGIISFYLGNMITATWLAMSIPMILYLL